MAKRDGAILLGALALALLAFYCAVRPASADEHLFLAVTDPPPAQTMTVHIVVRGSVYEFTLPEMDGGDFVATAERVSATGLGTCALEALRVAECPTDLDGDGRTLAPDLSIVLGELGKDCAP